jgi:hypothetical protein
MPARDNSAYLHELDAHHAQWRDQQPCRTYCLFCAWQHEGTALEARQAADAHRRDHHPDAKRTRRRRSRVWPTRRKDMVDPLLSPEENHEIQTERLRRARLNGIEQDLR